ncbi:MAG: response regulator, partial [Myxococcota bacterium]
PTRASFWDAFVSEARTKGRVLGVLECAPREGSRPLELLAVSEGDGHVTVTGVTRDEQARVEGTRQVQRLDVLTTLLQNVGHEFNNILTVVDSTSKMMQPLVVDHVGLRDMLNDIQDGCSDADRLIRQLRDFTRLWQDSAAPCDLLEVVRRALPTLKLTLPQAGRMRTSLEAQGPLVVALSVSDCLRLVMTALFAVHTSAKAMELSLTLSVDDELRQVALRCGPLDSPVPPAQMRPLASDERDGLTALLPMLKLLEPAGGQLMVYSDGRQRLSVEIVCPLEGMLSVAEPMAPEPPIDTTLLVVDDQHLLIRVVKRILARSGGYRVLAATSARDAMALVRSTPEISFVLMDVMMPEMTGVELAAHMLRERPNLPILHMTASPEAAQDLMAEAGWSAPLIQKPFAPEQLLTFIERSLATESNDGPTEPPHNLT